MEAVGTLAGGVAHDFNNLLQAISGYAELLLEAKSENDPEYTCHLKNIFQAGRSGAELIQHLLTFSRKIQPTLAPMDLNQRIRSIQKLLERSIPKMICIRLDLAEDLEMTNADPGQIEQVIINLALNARDAMEGKGSLLLRPKT